MINKQEFEEKRRELDEQIQALEDQIFLLQRKEHTERSVQSIQEAFALLEDQDQDLYKAFQLLLDEIIVHPDGEVDIIYSFGEPHLIVFSFAKGTYQKCNAEIECERTVAGSGGVGPAR